MLFSAEFGLAFAPATSSVATGLFSICGRSPSIMPPISGHGSGNGVIWLCPDPGHARYIGSPAVVA